MIYYINIIIKYIFRTPSLTLTVHQRRGRGLIRTRGRVAVRRGAACGSLANFAPPELSDCPRHTCCTSRITGARDDAAVLLHVAVRPTRILAKPARIGVRASVKARQHRDKRPGLLSNHARGTVPSLLLSLNLFNHCV